MPFSSRRRWSALQLGSTTYVLGAPELFPPNELQAVADREARAGRRVVAFGTARGRVDADSTPEIDEPLGLVVLGERLRADARETIEFLQSQGVRMLDHLRRPARDGGGGRGRRRDRRPGARRSRPADATRLRCAACSRSTP